MFELEFVFFLLSIFLTYRHLSRWYRSISSAWPPQHNRLAKHVLCWLPPLSLAIIVFTLKVLASFDVVDSFFYILFYILLGYGWLYLGVWCMTCLLDLSWVDDALHGGTASLFPVAGGYLAVTLIYCGANVGDGPGFWCVLFAGGLGLSAWVFLAFVIQKLTGAIERVTVERNLGCGIRLGGYFLASGIVLARASAGDWTSASMTVVEFGDGWPVLILVLLAIFSELYSKAKSRAEVEAEEIPLAGSIALGVLYVAIAVVSVYLLPPLNQNPIYGVVPIMGIQ